MPTLKYVAASSQYLQGLATPVVGYPFTFACWAKPHTLGSGGVFSMTSFATTAHFWALYFTAGGFAALETNAASDASAVHHIATSAGTWGHICGVCYSATLREIWWNGVKGTTPDTTNLTPLSVDRIAIGCIQRNPPISYSNTSSLDHAVWNRVLYPGEIRALAGGRWAEEIARKELVYNLRYRELPAFVNQIDAIGGIIMRPINGPGLEPSLPLIASPVLQVPMLGARL